MTSAPTTELRYSSRWVKWWLALVCAFVLAPFYAAPFLGEEEGVRIAIPICVPATYLLLQLAFNKRQAVVSAKGVRVRHRPFPTPMGMNVRREDIAHCYVREVVEYNEGQEIDRSYLAGVETKQGALQDVTDLLPSVNMAWEAAYQICGVLNTQPAAPKLEVRPVQKSARAPAGWKRTILLWLVLFLGAIAVGGYWELSRNHRSVDPRTGVRPL